MFQEKNGPFRQPFWVKEPYPFKKQFGHKGAISIVTRARGPQTKDPQKSAGSTRIQHRTVRHVALTHCPPDKQPSHVADTSRGYVVWIQRCAIPILWARIAGGRYAGMPVCGSSFPCRSHPRMAIIPCLLCCSIDAAIIRYWFRYRIVWPSTLQEGNDASIVSLLLSWYILVFFKKYQWYRTMRVVMCPFAPPFAVARSRSREWLLCSIRS